MESRQVVAGCVDCVMISIAPSAVADEGIGKMLELETVIFQSVPDWLVDER
jgi:hypothetical protein